MIEFHADDYGMFPASSERIIDCINEGVINGISLMANSPNLDDCMELFRKKCHKKVHLAIHLNLLTEKALGEKCRVSSLTDEEGYFNQSWFRLLAVSMIPGLRNRYRAQIKNELSLQIDRCLPYFSEEKEIRLDSHRHVHMIPMVFDVLAELIAEKGLKVSYIRITKDKIGLYRHINRFEHFRPINLIKVMLLNLLAAVDKKRHYALYECGNSDFASIMFSGCMTYRNLTQILSNIRQNRIMFRDNIELMLHPGAVLEKEDLEQIHDAEDRLYMPDPMRNSEAEACKKLWSVLNG